MAETVEPIHDERPGRVAAVDQGTNSTRLLVAEPDEAGAFEDLARDMVITRLGQGVDETARLAPEALRRTLAVLARYVRRARALHVERIRVAATAAVRDVQGPGSASVTASTTVRRRSPRGRAWPSRRHPGPAG